MSDIQEYVDFALRGLAFIEMMNDRERLQNIDLWSKDAEALGDPTEVIVGMNTIVTLLMEMIGQVTGASDELLIDALRQSIIAAGARDGI
jgi:hypothetical protein